MTRRVKSATAKKVKAQNEGTSNGFNEFQVRWQNFRSLHDTGWLPIKPLTILIGPNGGGKTSVIAPLLLLKQSLESRDASQALRTRGNLFDAGSFEDLISDKDASRDLILGVRFHSHVGEDASDLKPPPAYPPGEIELAFESTRSEASARLKTFTIRDIYGRDLIQRQRSDSGRFSFECAWIDKIKPELKQVIQEARPQHFLFSGNEVIQALLRQTTQALHQKGKKPADELFMPGQIRIDSSEAGILATLARTTTAITELLQGVSFIGPLRKNTQRFYEIAGEHPADVGTDGELAPEILLRKRDPATLGAVNEWLGKFGFGFAIDCVILGHDAYSLIIKRPDGVSLNAADTGFGLSQVLPLIVQCFSATPPNLLVAEQPEIHLNPKLQSRLADLFVEAKRRGHGILVETHSEHLLLRLRRLIAERHVRANDVSLLYAEPRGEKSIVRVIKIKENGDLNEWPKGFFEDSLGESLALAVAQASRTRH
jgi:hypothetical protein